MLKELQLMIVQLVDPVVRENFRRIELKVDELVRKVNELEKRVKELEDAP